MNIVIVAGEASGDLLGGKLIHSLVAHDNTVNISGIGGETMRAAGMHTLFDISETSVVGIVEVIKHYPKLHKILTSLKQHITNTKPALLILIDYPEFNLKLAAYAKKLNIKVLFYVSPQVWAWRTGRVKKIKSHVDLMAVLFPFELEFYEKEKIPTCLVRHPALDDVDKHCLTENNLNQTKIGLLPGSRINEIQKLLPIMIAAAERLYTNNKNLEFIIPIAPGLNQSQLKNLISNKIPITFRSENIYSAIGDCKIVAVASGTATLQTALIGKAMVIIYKISPLTYRLFGHMIKVEHIGLANIILGRRAFTELIQKDANADNLASEMEKLLNDAQLEEKMQNIRETIYNKLNIGISSHELALRALGLAKNN